MEMDTFDIEKPCEDPVNAMIRSIGMLRLLPLILLMQS